jgi:hypothetical protein
MNDHELKINTLEINQNNMAEKIDDLSYLVKAEFADLKKDLKENYVTKTEFSNVKVVVYGLISLILMAFGGAIVNLVLK